MVGKKCEREEKEKGIGAVKRINRWDEEEDRVEKLGKLHSGQGYKTGSTYG